MRIRNALVGIYSLGVDTSPFIYFTEHRAGYVDKVRTIFRHVFEGQIVVVASTIILTETLAKPLQNQADDLVAAYQALFENTQGISLCPVDQAIAVRAAHLCAQYNIKTPDALHLATAIEAGCQAFLTNDLDLRRVEEIRILALDDLELDGPGRSPS